MDLGLYRFHPEIHRSLYVDEWCFCLDDHDYNSDCMYR